MMIEMIDIAKVEETGEGERERDGGSKNRKMMK